MNTILAILGTFTLFGVGVHLSAFFSGCETGFYRANTLRLGIDAQAGDRLAKRILKFLQNPSYFVATTLVGNNIANYLTTVSIGLIIVAVMPADSRVWWYEIVATVMVAPLVFVFGELMPKNLYYRSPLMLLRKDISVFRFFYSLFLPISFPLIAISKGIESLGSQESKPLNQVLGRSRLTQVLGAGRREGILTQTQNQLVQGMMHSAVHPVSESMTPLSRVLGTSLESTREEILEHARKFGLTSVLVHQPQDEQSFGCLNVSDLSLDPRPVDSLLKALPILDRDESKLEALLTLRQQNAVFGVVCKEDRVLGIVNQRGLIEQLFHPPQTAFMG